MFTKIRRRFLTTGGTVLLCALSLVAFSATTAFAATTQTASNTTATLQSTPPPGARQPHPRPQPPKGPGHYGNKHACPPPFKPGDSGQDVRTLQRLLNNHGFRIRVTGHFDGPTKYAIQRFQRQHHWRTDGNAGNPVWQALGQC